MVPPFQRVAIHMALGTWPVQRSGPPLKVTWSRWVKQLPKRGSDHSSEYIAGIGRSSNEKARARRRYLPRATE